MKTLFNRLTLQVRITILTGFILTIITISMMLFSISSGNKLLTPAEESSPAMTIEMDDEPKVLPLSNSVAAQLEMKQAFDYRMIFFSGISIITGMILVYFVSGKAIKPVLQLQKDVEKIDEENLSQRLEQYESTPEMVALTDSMNHMLDRIEDAFGRQKQFAASAAHELKTPLTILKTTLQVKQKNQSLTEIEQEELVGLLKSVNRLNLTVDDLLLITNVSQLDELREEDIYTDLLVEEVLEELSGHYEEKQVKVKTELDPYVLRGSPDLLYRALFNLIENAYKYNVFQGDIFIKSYTTDKEAVLSIKNTGTEIESSHLEHLTDAFYRVDSSWSRDYSGVGLGLTIVKTILEKHDIELQITSDSKYTTVTLRKKLVE